MKEKEYLAYGYLLCMAVMIPWSNALINLLIVGGVLLIILNKITNKGKSIRPDLLHQLLFVFGTTFLLIILIRVLINPDYRGFKYVARLSTIILLPTMIFKMASQIPPSQNIKLLRYYTHSVSVLSLGTLAVTYAKTIEKETTPFSLMDLSYKELSGSLIHHEPIYFSIMVGAAIIFCVLVLLFYAEKQKMVFYYLEVLFLLFFLFLLGSRTAILGTFLCLGVLGVIKSRKMLIYLTLLFSIIFLLNYKFNPSFQARVNHVVNFSTDFDYQNDWSYEGLALRYMTWNCSLEGIKYNFLMGTGISKAQQSLDNCYKEHGYESLLYFKRQNGTVFNSHNVYLDIFLKFGILGVTLLVAITMLLLLSAIKHKNILLFLMILFFMVNGITESLLVREKGIVFFSFFIGLSLCFCPSREVDKME